MVFDRKGCAHACSRYEIARDDAAKLEHILQSLQSNDYIVLSSNRLYNTIPRLPQRYPLTSRYYELLMGERLGFELVYYAESDPELFGVRIVTLIIGNDSGVHLLTGNVFSRAE